MTDPLLGLRVIGNYCITDKLGEGGAGAVYVALNAELNKRLAIKVLLPEWAGNAQLVERFVGEARAASAIEHPNIIKMIDSGELAGGTRYIAMEYLDGASLDVFAARHVPMRVEMVLAIVLQICAGLQAAHDRGVIHRDLKPQNVVVSPQETNPTFLKILDFGIAKLLDGRLRGDIRTQTSTIAGTPGYMSPEQARATRDVDHRTDIYALAVIAYELLTERMPFIAANVADLIWQQQRGDVPPPVTRMRADVPQAWSDLIEHGLSLEPRQRPQTMVEFALAAIGATPGGDRIARRVAPHLLAATDRVTVVDAGGGLAATAPALPSSPGRPPLVTVAPVTVVLPEPAPPVAVRSRRWVLVGVLVGLCAMVGGGAAWWRTGSEQRELASPIASVAIAEATDVGAAAGSVVDAGVRPRSRDAGVIDARPHDSKAPAVQATDAAILKRRQPVRRRVRRPRRTRPGRRPVDVRKKTTTPPARKPKLPAPTKPTPDPTSFDPDAPAG